MPAGFESDDTDKLPFPVKYFRHFGGEEIDPAQHAEDTLQQIEKIQTKAAERRAKRERKIRAERIKTLTTTLRLHRTCGVRVVRGLVTATFYDSLEEKYGPERILKLQAEGNIQGTDRGFDHAVNVSTAMSEHWKQNEDKGLLIFDGTNFGGNAGGGTKRVAERVQQIVSRQREVGGKNHNDMMVLFVGHEPIIGPEEAPEHPSNTLKIIENIAVNYKLGSDNELTPAIQPTDFADYVAPELRITTKEIESLEEPHQDLM